MQNITITKQDTYTITFNKGYICSLHGGIKIIQFVLGLICVLITIIEHNYCQRSSFHFFQIVAVSFLIGTFCHVFAEMFSSKNVVSGITNATKIFGSHAAELVYGYVYNALGALLYIVSSGILISDSHKLLYVGTILGMMNGLAYLVAAIINGKF